MIPVFEEVYSLDKNCYQNGLSEAILMENASRAIYEEVKKFNSICIVAGAGNNGADGIALARMLLGERKVHLFLPMGVKSEMAKFQFKIYKNYGGEYSEFKLTKKENYECYVDAIFGSGLKRDLTPEINRIIKNINKQKGVKIACDIPTGLDENGNRRGEVFKADKTITMGAIKLALLSDEAKNFVGEIKIANLGVEFQKYSTKSDYFLLQKSELHLPFREKKNSHKGTFGHLGVLVGEKEGAGIIAGLSALNFGAGLVTCVTKDKTSIPFELMHSSQISDRFTALVMGMGMGNFFDDEIEKISNLEIPMVIDADLFYNEKIKLFLNKKVIFTPHPKEFASLLEIIKMGEFDTKTIQKNRFKLAKEFSKKYPHIVLVLKGANTIIAYKNKVYINNFGSPALSKGGSGDVLAGMIGALIAQKYHPLKASFTAVIQHSLIGENYTPNYSLTPLKIIKKLGETF